MSLKDWFIEGNASKESVATNSIYLLDGGVSTHLSDLYKADFEYPELWSSSLLMTPEGKDIIVQGHKDWLKSGTNILTTVTYQCHDISKVINDEQMEQMLRDGVKLAQRAIAELPGENRFVVASMGCYGGALADGSEYTGNYPNIHSEKDLVDFHRLKTQVLLEEEPDGLALETVPCVLECRAFVLLLQELREKQSIPACWISLACRNGEELNDGTKIEEALEAIQQLDPKADLIQAIGINCCDSGYVSSLVRRIIATMSRPGQPRRGLVIYPNSGEEWDAQTKTWKEGTGLRKDDLQDAFADRLMKTIGIVLDMWRELKPGCQPPKLVLGGCCRTTPKTIATLRKQVDEHQESINTSQAPLTTEQQKMMDQILARDADFDRQIGEIGKKIGGEERPKESRDHI